MGLADPSSATLREVNPGNGPIVIGNANSLSGKVAIVTGAASGIGRQTAEILSSMGAEVAAVDRSFPESDSVREVHCDVSRPDGIQRAVGHIGRTLGHIDILVNCAGIVGPPTTITDVSESDWDLVHSVNLKSVVFMCQSVIPFMSATANGGHIVNISSASAHRSSATSVAYASSKAAIEAVTRVLAGELARFEINVNAVAPGVTATAIYAGDSQGAQADRAANGFVSNLFSRVATPDDIAEVIAFLCMPESRQITGQVIHASAGSIL